MDLGLSGRACVVTGASRGIGRATARMLCAEGADVLLVARSEDALLEAADECAAAGQEAGGRAESLVADVTEPDAAERIVKEAGERLGQLDVLVNNAGTARRRDLDDVPDEDWYAAWELNVMAPMRLMRAAVPGNARSRLGPHRQRLQLVGKAPVGEHARVLRGQGRRALAVAAVRRPLRGGWRPDQRDLPGARSIPSSGRSEGGLLDQVMEMEGLSSRDEALEAAAARSPDRPAGRDR